VNFIGSSRPTRIRAFELIDGVPTWTTFTGGTISSNGTTLTITGGTFTRDMIGGYGNLASGTSYFQIIGYVNSTTLTISNLVFAATTDYVICYSLGAYLDTFTDVYGAIIPYNQYLFAARSAGAPAGLDVFDVRSARIFTKVATLTIASFAPQVLAIYQNYLLMYASSGAIRLVDIRNPSSVLTTVSGAATTLAAVYTRLKADNGYLYGTSGANLHVYRFSDLLAGTTSTYAALALGVALQTLDIKDRYLYVTDTNSGSALLYIVDLFDRATPYLLATVTIGVNSAIQTTAVHDDRLYVGFLNGRVYVWDISTPASPVKLGNVSGVTTESSVRTYFDLPTVVQSGMIIGDGIVTKGRYAYFTHSGGITSYRIGGVQTNGVHAGSVETGSLVAESKAYFRNDVFAQQDMYVGGGVSAVGCITTNNFLSTPRFITFETVTNVSGTLTAAAMAGGIVTASANVTLDTAANIVANSTFKSILQTGAVFRVHAFNTAASSITITSGTGTTMTNSGNAAIVARDSRVLVFLCTNVATPAFTVY
jgi:hypothetical protein